MRQKVELGKVTKDIKWVLRVGVVRIMDKLIEHAEFANGVHQIYHIYFVVGEELVCTGLKARIDVGNYNPKASDSCSSHICDMEQDIVDFVTLDCTSMLGLGHLDIAGLWMCTFDTEESVINKDKYYYKSKTIVHN